MPGVWGVKVLVAETAPWNITGVRALSILCFLFYKKKERKLSVIKVSVAEIMAKPYLMNLLQTDKEAFILSVHLSVHLTCLKHLVHLFIALPSLE